MEQPPNQKEFTADEVRDFLLDLLPVNSPRRTEIEENLKLDPENGTVARLLKQEAERIFARIDAVVDQSWINSMNRGARK